MAFVKEISMNEYNFYKLLRGSGITPDILEIEPGRLKIPIYDSTLGDILMNIPLTESQISELYERVRDLIRKLHQMGVIHGDLHNDNILCSTDLTDIRLIDFEKSTFVDLVDDEYLEYYDSIFGTKAMSVDDILEHELHNFED